MFEMLLLLGPALREASFQSTKANMPEPLTDLASMGPGNNTEVSKAAGWTTKGFIEASSAEELAITNFSFVFARALSTHCFCD